MSSVWLLLFLAQLVCQARGQVFFSKCQGIVNYNICVELQTVDCAISIRVKAGNTVLVQQTVQQSIAPEVCGTLAGTQICVVLSSLNISRTNPSAPTLSGCPTLEYRASLFPLTYKLGCFNDVPLNPNCYRCPNSCSQQGACQSDGSCLCYTGFSGLDCSTSTVWTQCLTDLAGQANLDAPFCASVSFVNCQMSISVDLDSPVLPIQLWQDSLSLPEWQQFIASQPQGANFAVLPNCNVNLPITKLVISSAQISGCLNAQFDCPALPAIPTSVQQIGCFNDTTIAAKCFGSCPSLCNSHGDCNNGFCQCYSGWRGYDCSQQDCNPTCDSVHGVCTEALQCQCNRGWSGASCSVPAPVASGGGDITTSNVYSSEAAPKSNPLVIVVIVLAVLVALVAGVGGFLFWRRHVAKKSVRYGTLGFEEDNEPIN